MRVIIFAVFEDPGETMKIFTSKITYRAYTGSILAIIYMLARALGWPGWLYYGKIGGVALSQGSILKM